MDIAFKIDIDPYTAVMDHVVEHSKITFFLTLKRVLSKTTAEML